MNFWILTGLLAAFVAYVDVRHTDRTEERPEPKEKLELTTEAAERYAQMLWGNLQVELQDLPYWTALDPENRAAFTRVAIAAANQNRAVTYQEIEIILNSAREGA
jgi:hypothetical protein